MSQRDDYASELKKASDQVTFLREHSGLPGPRGNLELMQAAADIGDEPSFQKWITVGSGGQATDEFLAICGIVGFGRLVVEGRRDLVAELYAHASDPRWRVREAVAMALQRVPETLAATLPPSDVRYAHQSGDDITTFGPRLVIQSGRFAGLLPPRGLVWSYGWPREYSSPTK